MKPVVIVGGTGFIGSAIARTCERHTSVTSLGSAECNLLDQSSCRDKLHSLGPGAILVYGAGIPRLKDDTLTALLDNFAMVNHVLCAIEECRPDRLIVLSS